MAGRVMEQWQTDGLPRHPRRASVLRAIHEHDNGWNELDESPIVDEVTGRIADFITLPLELRQGVWPRGVARLADDPWAAALVAQHAVHVYSRFRGNPDWDPFFGRLETIRDGHLTRAGLDLDTLRQDYAFVRLGDLISLAFCAQWTDEQRDFGYALQGDGTHITIAPDPFGVTVPLVVRARELPKRAYRDAADAREVWLRAEEIVLSGELRPA